MLLQSTITCPHCSVAKTETMPTDACRFFYECTGCGTKLKPKPGDCCVFCSYGSVPCPPIQAERSGERGAAFCCAEAVTVSTDTDASARDWLRSPTASLLAWWGPQTAIVAGLLVSVPVRAAIWTVALVWMGVACILNARQCGRTHCRYTGPYYLGMIAPLFLLAAGIGSGGFAGWLILGVLILAGSRIIWWTTEHAWGKFSS